MKKRILFSIAAMLMTFTVSIFAINPDGGGNKDKATQEDSQRMVLLEHFTNTGCGACPGGAASIADLIAAGENSQKITHIAWHVSGPSPDDPHYMFLDAQGMGSRSSLYSVSGVPDGVIGGTVQDHPSSLTQTQVDDEYAKPGKFNITGSGIYASGFLQIKVNLEGLDDLGGDLKFFVVLIEDMHYATAPGSNGETDFANVARTMFPDGQGTALTGVTASYSETFEWDYTIPAEIIIENCDLVCFVQDMTSKEVHMAMQLPVTSCTMETSSHVQNVSLNGGNDGQATVIGTNAVPPYYYQWNNPDSSQSATIINLPAGEYTCTVMDSGDPPCLVIITIEITEPAVGIEDIENNISIYPNPSNGILNIENANNSRVILYNILGDAIQTMEVNSEHTTLDLMSLPKGNYFLKVYQGDKTITRKISLQ